MDFGTISSFYFDPVHNENPPHSLSNLFDDLIAGSSHIDNFIVTHEYLKLNGSQILEDIVGIFKTEGLYINFNNTDQLNFDDPA